ncbi:Potassium channel [Oenococcus oeni]|uniref:TMEM175 family protein n=1 Tax=Oenococcus oeni TaxID=1247 RepID=UPI0010790E4E|nr:TMEM175 family protein [Oenococcus oeni]AVI94409.1 hypothetical protein AX764_06010 [Oenococcus oeni]SYW02831.1 Potassium channel [Oenococcus oeni]SYW03629.1 Potassium channel [Oenococcus oeni]SYW19183.1 Potassium channel [Oenococcus oeni]VDC14975.1 Potassium channel [Oenococcus oeni]
MNKSRVEAYTDAVVAIIITIMILEFKVPNSAKWKGITQQFPYFFAYIISFIFIGVAWYNHHYMFALAIRISKKVYWVNNFWLFSMSLLPIATGWVGKFPNFRNPEYLYFLVFIFWSLTYLWLSNSIRTTAEHIHSKVDRSISNMPPFKFLNSIFFPISIIITIIGIYIYPIFGLCFTLLELVILAFLTTNDSDQIN